jgi:phytoene dehydrogenase-like protein
MKNGGRRIVIVGGGIAGLCAAVFAQRCGYQAEVLEMQSMAGGLATSWHRGPYTFETCLHWLVGSKPDGDMHAQWKEVCDIEKLKFIDHDEFMRLETEHGDSLNFYTNVDRLEEELLKKAPADAAEIRRFISQVRDIGKFKLPDPAGGWANWSTYLHDLPYFPLLRRLSHMSGKEYGKRFTNPLVRAFFGEGDMGQMCALAMIFSLAWMNARNAGYTPGGSQALIRLIQQKLVSLGGRVRFGARVERILTENGTAVGVKLADGETVRADWVISAADGHATIYDLLGGKYTSRAINKTYETLETFPSYLQVSLGVALDLSGWPPSVTRLLDLPFEVDPGTELRHVGFRIFNFDPTFAPAGKTAITCFLPTRNYEYWVHLQEHDPARYHEEKHRVAEQVVSILERRIPALRLALEVTDVSTPATVINYTGNWKGSMEGWFLSPGMGFRPLRNTLPGLRRFMMVGQWVMPGGGLPSGMMTARPAIQAICKKDGVPFVVHDQHDLQGAVLHPS